MTNFKFTQGYDDQASQGAEPFETGEEPFYGYFGEYTIIIDLYGVALYGYNAETDKVWSYVDNTSGKIMTYNEALDLISLIEFNPAAFIKLAERTFDYNLV